MRGLLYAMCTRQIRPPNSYILHIQYSSTDLPQNVTGNEVLYMNVLSLDCVSMYALSGEKEIPMKENSAYEGVQIQPPNRGSVNQMEPCPAYGVVGGRQ